MYYAIIFGGIAYNIATERIYVIPFLLAVLTITAGWNLDYARLLSLQKENQDLEQKVKNNRLKFIKVLDVEKVRYANLYAQNQSILKENDDLKLTIHNFTEERASLRKQLNALKRKNDNTKKKTAWRNTQTSRSEKK